MNKRNIVCGIVAIAIVCGIAASAISYDWNMKDGPKAIPFGLEDDGTLADNSINYMMFEVWGPILLVLGTVMFGAIIAGVCISKEEEERKEGEE